MECQSFFKIQQKRDPLPSNTSAFKGLAQDIEEDVQFPPQPDSTPGHFVSYYILGGEEEMTQ